jgi:hypothetical protein
MELLTILRSSSDSTAKLIGGIIGTIIILIISAVRKNKKARQAKNPPPAPKDSSLDRVIENQKKLEEMGKPEGDSIWEDGRK